MKIAFFISSLNIGGAEKQSILDANIMVKENEVFLLFFTDGTQKELLDSRVVLFQLVKKSYLTNAFVLVRYVKKNNIDLIHCSLFAPMVTSALASLFTKIKVIWHFHSHEYDIPLKSQEAFRYLAKLPSVKKILFVNHELMNHFSFYHFPANKSAVLYNHSEINNPPLKTNDHHKLVNIGYLGRIVKLKRVHYLIELAEYLIRQERFTDFKIHIVGDGEAMEEIKTLLINSGCNDYFFFHGFQKEVVEYYQKFDLFVNPSSEECLSMAMIDAGMMGLPMVAFDVGGNNEIVVNGVTGYIVNDKPEFFSRCYQLISQPEQRKIFGMKAQIHCRKNFSAEKHFGEIKKIYAEIF